MKNYNKYFVYVLLYSKLINKRYIRSTQDLAKRVMEHNRGNSRYTKRGIPWIIIHHEEYDSKTEALKRENFLKSGQGRKFLDQLNLKY